MWDAAAWLDVYDLAEAEVASIATAMRGTDPVPVRNDLSFPGCRHASTITADTLASRLSAILPEVLNSLARAQRLSVADELSTDADARAASLALLPTGQDPAEPDSRIWQAAAITRATQSGLANYLPDGAAGWSARLFDNDRSPAERWGARNMLHRVEQLEEAAKTIGARGGAEFDPFGAHLVFPLELFGLHLDTEGTDTAAIRVEKPTSEFAGSALADLYRAHAAEAAPTDEGYLWIGDAVVYVRPTTDMLRTAPWDRDVFSDLEVSVSLLTPAGSRREVVAVLDPGDDEGFQSTLGRWVTRASYRP